MRLLILIFIFLSCILSAAATHIVGGELQLKHLTGADYQLTLHMYFDKVNGNPLAIDQSIRVSIFEKNTNRQITLLTMSNPQSSPVAYTSIACTNASLSTDKVVYSRTVTLPESTYNSPNGYYLVWERCCRNGVISNIERPGDAGQTFYLEFPAVVRNGQPFRNSSPELFPPVSDYACLNELFYYDFGGKDADGDSLVYDMVTPLNGWSTPFTPGPDALPGPYPLVNWTAGLNTNNQIPGNPTISISANTGLLTVRPSRLGLFVFGVRCSEYRNRVKIGEVRRDYQLLVLNCPRNEKPKVNVQPLGTQNLYREGDVIRMDPAGNRCLQILVTDPDPDELVSVVAKPVNFSLSDPLVNLNTGIVNRNGIRDTLKTTACFQPCFDTQGKTYLIDFIVSDDGCSLPKKDTIRVAFQLGPVPNTPPAISTTAPALILRPRVGEVLDFDVLGTDPENEVVNLTLTGINFAPGTQNFSFPPASAAGRVQSHFNWKIDCHALRQPSYLLKFKATTIVCGKAVADSTVIEVQPQDPNRPPAISTPLAGKIIDILLGTAFSGEVLAIDPDGDLVSLTAAGDGFNLADYGIQFPAASGPGQARSVLTWTPSCSLQGRSEFKINFSVKEETCRPQAPPPVGVTFRILFKPENNFNPANIFTPNQDGLNDFFELPTLPPDFCGSTFARIQIFNRWGQLVYQSSDRNFKWDGRTLNDGVYFYLVTYSDKQFKGTVTKVR